VALELRIVHGADFAADVSRILRAAWPVPSLNYSPEYIRWQLTFPGPCTAPAAIAFDGAAAVACAATLHRRLGDIDVLLVSFVAVDPNYQNRGLAGELYRNLLTSIRETSLPIVTFARVGTPGQRAIERSYSAAGVDLQPFGSYVPYGIMVRPEPPAASDWVVAATEDAALRPSIAGRTAPTPAQRLHYLRDPRDRRLLVHGDARAWAVRMEYTSFKGLDVVTTLEMIDADNPELLPGLAAAAARLWAPSDSTAMVHAPNLWGFDVEALRGVGFRRIGPPWVAYFASSGGEQAPAPGTNLEII
jgi:hypothetical protein